MIPLGQVLRHGGLGDVVAELEELAVDARGAPEWVLRREPMDQSADLELDARPTQAPLSALSPPVQPPPQPVPADDGLRLDDGQVAPPVAAELA
jgi:hypothetical protein